jgi:hypothetical protein
MRGQYLHLNGSISGDFFLEADEYDGARDDPGFFCASLLPSPRMASACEVAAGAGAVEGVHEPVDSIGKGRDREKIRFLLMNLEAA